MRMTHRAVTMRVTVRLGSLPSLVLVIMVGTVSVTMLVTCLSVLVFELLAVSGRPKYCSQERERNDTHAKGKRSGLDTKMRAQLPGNEVTNQPAGMG